MPYIARNDAYSVLAGNLAADGNTLTLATGHGDLRFPVVAPPDYSHVTVEDSNGRTEPMKVIKREAGSDQLTLARGAASGILPTPVPQAWAAGALVEIRPLAHVVQDSFNHIGQATGAHAASAIAVTPAGNVATTNVQAALEELDAEKLQKSTGGTVSGPLNLEAELQLAASPGTVGRVLSSMGPGVPPAWTGAPPEFSSTDTGTGDITLSASSQGAIEEVLSRAVGGVVDYRIYTQSAYEVGTGSVFRGTTAFDAPVDCTNQLQGRSANGMASNGTTVVAVANDGYIVSSTDGQEWVKRESGTIHHLNAVTWDGSQFVAVGNAEKVLTSPDGITWALRNDKVGFTATSVNKSAVGANGVALVLSGGTVRSYGRTADNGDTWQELLIPAEFGLINPSTFPLWDGSAFYLCTTLGFVLRSADGISWVKRGEVPFISGQAYRFFQVGASLLVVTSNGSSFTSSDNGANWTERTTPLYANHAAMVSGRVLILANSSTAGYYTTDGINWTATTVPASAGVLSSANGVFFMCPATASTSVYTSTDGITWTTRTLPSSQNWQGVAWNGTNYVTYAYRTTGAAGVAATSSNLSSWTARSYGAGGAANGVFALGAKVVLIGSANLGSGGNHLGAMYVSTDSGAAFTDVTFTYFGTTALLTVAYSAGVGKHVASGNYGVLLYTSDNFTTVTRTTISSLLSDGALSLGADVAGYVLGSGTGVLLVSADGINWTAKTSTFSTQPIRGIANNGAGLWLAVGSNGQVAYSTDTNTWTAVSPGLGTNIIFFAFWDGGQFIIGGDAGALAKSADAVTWTSLSANSQFPAGSGSAIRTGCKHGAVRLTGGTFGNFAISTDATAWALTEGSCGFFSQVTGVAYGAGLYVVVGYLGRIATSTDGKKWVQRVNPFAVTDQILGIIFAGGKFVAFGGTSGNASRLATSTDGVTWTMQASASSAMTQAIRGVAHNGSSYCAVDGGLVVATSSDAVTWVSRGAQGSGSVPLGMCYGNGVFAFACFSLYSIYYSSDGITWKRAYVPWYNNNYSTFGFANNKFYAAASGSNVYGLWLSDSCTSWTAEPTQKHSGPSAFLYAESDTVQVSSLLQSTGPGLAVSTDNFASAALVGSLTITSGSAMSLANGLFFLRGPSLMVMPSSGYCLKLRREKVLASSSAGSKVVLAAGAKSVGLAPVAAPAIGMVAEWAGEQRYGTWLPANGTDVDSRVYPASRSLPRTSTPHFDRLFNLPDTNYVVSAYVNGLFLANYPNASASVVLSSPDGNIWTPRTLPATINWRAPVSNGAVALITQGASTTSYATSTDGIVWTARSSFPSSASWGVTAFNGRFYASAGSTIYYSNDGLTWNVTSGLPSAGVNTLAFALGGSTWLALSSSGTAYTSTDGISWTSRTISSQTWETALYGNNLFMALQGSVSTNYATSPDGVTWTSRTLPAAPGTYAANKSWMAYGNSTWVFAGNTSQLYYSAGGVAWTAGASSATVGTPVAVFFYGGLFYLLATSGSNTRVYTSADGIAWSLQSSTYSSQNSFVSTADVRGSFPLINIGYGLGLSGSPDFWAGIPNIPTRSTLAPPKVRVA